MKIFAGLLVLVIIIAVLSDSNNGRAQQYREVKPPTIFSSSPNAETSLADVNSSDGLDALEKAESAPIQVDQVPTKNELARQRFMSSHGKDLEVAIQALEVAEATWRERVKELADALSDEGRNPSSDLTYNQWVSEWRDSQNHLRDARAKATESFLAYQKGRLGPSPDWQQKKLQQFHRSLSEAERLRKKFLPPRIPLPNPLPPPPVPSSSKKILASPPAISRSDKGSDHWAKNSCSLPHKTSHAVINTDQMDPVDSENDNKSNAKTETEPITSPIRPRFEAGRTEWFLTQ